MNETHAITHTHQEGDSLQGDSRGQFLTDKGQSLDGKADVRRSQRNYERNDSKLDSRALRGLEGDVRGDRKVAKFMME